MSRTPSLQRRMTLRETALNRPLGIRPPLRRILRRLDSGSFASSPMEQLRNGDVFRIVDVGLFKAVSSPRTREGIWEIDCVRYRELWYE